MQKAFLRHLRLDVCPFQKEISLLFNFLLLYSFFYVYSQLKQCLEFTICEDYAFMGSDCAQVAHLVAMPSWLRSACCCLASWRKKFILSLLAGFHWKLLLNVLFRCVSMSTLNAYGFN